MSPCKYLGVHRTETLLHSCRLPSFMHVSSNRMRFHFSCAQRCLKFSVCFRVLGFFCCIKEVSGSDWLFELLHAFSIHNYISDRVREGWTNHVTFWNGGSKNNELSLYVSWYHFCKQMEYIPILNKIDSFTGAGTGIRAKTTKHFLRCMHA